MGMLVNDVTALVASLAKVCQPRLRGGWGLGQLGGSGPATGHSCRAPHFCCPASEPLHLSFLPGGVILVICSVRVRYYTRCWGESFSGQGV